MPRIYLQLNNRASPQNDSFEWNAKIKLFERVEKKQNKRNDSKREENLIWFIFEALITLQLGLKISSESSQLPKIMFKI